MRICRRCLADTAEAQPANQPELQQPASRSAAIRLLATLAVTNHPPRSEERKISLAQLNATCTTCKHQFISVPKRSFLGFRKLICPACGASVTYPLTRSYRITYWILFIFMILPIIGSYAQGEIGIPGGLGIAVAIALFRDYSIHQKVQRVTNSK